MKNLSAIFVWLFLLTTSVCLAQDSPNLELRLLNALNKRRPSAALEAIQQGAKVNLVTSEGTPYLIIAVKHGYTEVVEAMIGKGVNPHNKDQSGRTAIIQAAEKGRLAEIKLLTDPNLGEHVEIGKTGQVRYDRKANVNDQDEIGNTALIVAAAKKRFDVVEELLNKGAEVNHQNLRGGDALMAAAYRGDEALVGLLLSKGADTALRTKDGKTALDFALKKKRKAVAILLGGKVLEHSLLSTTSYSLNRKKKTSLEVNPGDKLVFRADGWVIFGGYVGAGGPNGIDGHRGFNLLRGGSSRHGVLLARVKGKRRKEAWYIIGNSGEFVSKVQGKLELNVNDQSPRDNQGEFNVEVMLYRAK